MKCLRSIASDYGSRDPFSDAVYNEQHDAFEYATDERRLNRMQWFFNAAAWDEVGAR